MLNPRRVPFCVLAALALVPVSAPAQTAAPTYFVSVTEPDELVEAVGTTRRVGRAEIEARNARTLDEALRLFPGVYIRTGGDGTPRVDIRGFRSRHVLLLVDGVQVNSTSDGQFDPARISTTAIREIKVSYGSSSVLYGDNALAAVVEIATVDGRPDASVELSAGTPGQWGTGGRFARSRGPWSVTAAATGFATDGFRLPGSFVPTATENGGRRDNSDRDRGDLRGTVGYRVSPAVTLGTEWSVAAGSYGLPFSTISDPDDVYAAAVRYERVEQFRGTSGQASVVVAPGGRFNIRAWAYRNAQREDRSRYDDATYSSMDDPLVSGTFQSRERTVVTGSTALARVDLRRAGWLRLAVNQRREGFDSDGVIRDVAAGGTAGGGGGGGGRGGGGRPPTSYDVRAFAIDHHVDVYSTGAEWQFHPAPRLGAVLGSAVNWQRRADGPSETEPTWIAGVSYEATSAVRLHASATRKIRVPSIDQLYSAAAGNPALRPEHAYGLDAGVDQRVGQVSTVGLSAFVTRAKDFIERLSGEPFANREDYRFAGAELTAQTRAIARLDLRGAYTFMDSVAIAPGEADQPLQTRPRHRSSLEWNWTPVEASSLRGSVQYVGRQLYDSRGAVPIQRSVKGYTLVDIGFSQALTRHAALAFDVSNLFDQLYDQSYALPREGRAAILTLRVRPR